MHRDGNGSSAYERTQPVRVPYPRDEFMPYGTQIRPRALDDDWPGVLAALRLGIQQKDDAEAAKAAGDYVALVYGRQLQQKEDEGPRTDPLHVASMTREERDALKRKLIAANPEAARALGLASDTKAVV
jgi:hypothetical protein